MDVTVHGEENTPIGSVGTARPADEALQRDVRVGKGRCAEWETIVVSIISHVDERMLAYC